VSRNGRIFHIKDTHDGAELDDFRPLYVTSYDMEDACLVKDDTWGELHHNDEELLRSPHPMQQYWYALKAAW
jgi:hypothetical protein